LQASNIKCQGQFYLVGMQFVRRGRTAAVEKTPKLTYEEIREACIANMVRIGDRVRARHALHDVEVDANTQAMSLLRGVVTEYDTSGKIIKSMSRMAWKVFARRVSHSATHFIETFKERVRNDAEYAREQVLKTQLLEEED
jgi:hypothetical protein